MKKRNCSHASDICGKYFQRNDQLDCKKSHNWCESRIVDSSGRQRIFHGSNVVCIYLDLGFFENFLDTNLKTYHMSALPPRCTRPPRSFRSRRSLMLATVLVRRTRTSWPVWVTIPSGKGKCTLQKTWQLDKYFKKGLEFSGQDLSPPGGSTIWPTWLRCIRDIWHTARSSLHISPTVLAKIWHIIGCTININCWAISSIQICMTCKRQKSTVWRENWTSSKETLKITQNLGQLLECSHFDRGPIRRRSSNRLLLLCDWRFLFRRRLAPSAPRWSHFMESSF